MPSHPNLDTARKVLIVEGYSDLRFYAELLQYVGAHEQVFIKHFNGRADLETKLETFVTPQLLQSMDAVGVVVDANGDGPATAARLTQQLRSLTNQGVACGAWTHGQPRVGLSIVPSSDGIGEIETLVWRAWSSDVANRNAVECIEAYAVCMQRIGIKANSREKGRIGALLALRNDDDPRLGPGAQAGVFDFGRPELVPLIEFLTGFLG